MPIIRPNVSGGAGGERWDRRAKVKSMARTARRSQDAALIAEGLDEDFGDVSDWDAFDDPPTQHLDRPVATLDGDVIDWPRGWDERL